MNIKSTLHSSKLSRVRKRKEKILKRKQVNIE